MLRFRSFPSRPFYSFSSTIKNLFEARDFLLSRDRRRNAPSLIPIPTNVTRARFLVSSGGFSWFLSNEPPCTVEWGFLLFRSNRKSSRMKSKQDEIFCFLIFWTIYLIISCYCIIVQVLTGSKNNNNNVWTILRGFRILCIFIAIFFIYLFIFVGITNWYKNTKKEKKGIK